jgi:protein ImuA
MSQGGVSERILFLRRSLAAIEARDGAQAALELPQWAESAISRHPIERALEGLSAAGFGEIVPARPRDAAGAASFAFALALRSGPAHSRARVWIAEDMVASEIGLPYGRGLAAFGFDPQRLLLARSRRPRETLWAMEEALKAKAVVVAETWMAPKTYDLATSRRLLLAARKGGAGLLLLPRAAGEARRLSTAAHIRFEVASLPIARDGAAARRLPLPGPLAWRVRIAKARASLLGALGDFDPSEWRDVAFDPEKSVFRHAFPQRLPAPPFDRPDFERRRESA